MEKKELMLVDKKEIALLFQKGRIVKSLPLLIYSMNSSKKKILFSVPKKKVKKAVDRNRIKRQLREIYFNLSSLNKQTKTNQTLAFVYISSTKTSTVLLKERMKKLVDTL